ncbi:MAG: alpha/beta fold hydrolase [Planctomycetes bacterium]|nr:alpha/beta fold hydrolase [Planctomycetota bacterium]
MNDTRNCELVFSRPITPGHVCQGRTLSLGDYNTLLLYHHHRPHRPVPIVMLHGIQSHPGWFVGSASAMAQAGYRVFQFQRRGSGADTGARGHARSAGQLLNDLDLAVNYVLQETGARQVHMVGISWGGKYATCYCLRRLCAERVSSLTLVAPGIRPRVDVPWPIKLAVAVCSLIAPQKRFDIPLSDPALFTDNCEMREYIRTDPHRLARATAAFMLSSRMMDRLVAGADADALRLPVNLLLASADRIIDNAATCTLIARLAGANLKTVELQGAHTLEFEPDPTAFFDALAQAVIGSE